MIRKKVLFLCVNNSCRSQMAEGFLRAAAPETFDALSAGANATFVHPLAIEVMDELGIDISRQWSKTAASLGGLDFDYVVTVCDESAGACPAFAGAAGERLAWSFPDPAAAVGGAADRLDSFRAVRDRIGESVKRFVVEHG
ncbi:MAG: arsenate reductase ArsC [Candidatus Geothermincolia bacterium]